MKEKTSKKSKRETADDSSEVSPQEALKKVKSFSQRKEAFIAAVKKSQN